MREDYWNLEITELLAELGSVRAGLSEAEARERLARLGPNVIARERSAPALRVLANQFRSPLILILVAAAAVTLILRDLLESSIILAVIGTSALLGFYQEYRASLAVARLQARLALRVNVLRGGKPTWVPMTEVVPGDVLILNAGALVAGDARLLEARDLFADEAVLTGESFPAEKRVGIVPSTARLSERTNCLFTGTSVRSGTGLAAVVRTGPATELGAIGERLRQKAPRTEFERGLAAFGLLLLRVVILLVLAVLAANIVLQRPPIDSLLFGLALAVGLTPELLPTILTVTLAHGARALADRGVLVRRLSSIENLGSMDVLLTDKTGTLTRGVMRLQEIVDCAGQPAPSLLAVAAINAKLQTGIANPLDEAILQRTIADGLEPSFPRKIDEIPFDFERKRITVVVEAEEGRARMITKGAVQQVLAICSEVAPTETGSPLDVTPEAILERFQRWSGAGLRVLALATRDLDRQATYSREDERGLTLVGFLLFEDPPEPEATHAIADLRERGITMKIVTGDNRHVAFHVASRVGNIGDRVLSGDRIDRLTDVALVREAETTDVFAEVEPAQKVRILEALRAGGHVVGFLGDGINDAPALHAADVGVSVQSAVDVAREAADIVLLERNIQVLRQGVEEGRRTFANTVKYINITTSANFGNMISMAAATLFLPFLPLLPAQILLNNLLSDIPLTLVSGDRVDREWTRVPRRWSVKGVRDAMLVFGGISSAFDFLTFGALLILVGEDFALFRTGWFLESLLTELAVVLVLRTSLPALRSRPAPALVVALIGTGVLALVLPLTPLGAIFNLDPVPPHLLAILAAIVALYLAATEFAKRRLFRPFLKPGLVSG